MIFLLLWWFALIAIAVLVAGQRTRLSPMLLAYLAGLSTIHVPGAVNFLGPADFLTGELETYVGFQATLLGMSAMLVGAMLARAPIKQLEWSGANSSSADPARRQALATMGHHALGLLMIGIGVVAYFVALPVASMIPSLSSLVAPLGSLLIVGIWVLVYDAAQRRDARQLATIVLFLPLLPLSTLLVGGFLGFGVVWLICIFAAIYCFWPRRLLFLAAAPLLAYLGLSLGTAYMLEREQIREVIWGEQADFDERWRSVLLISDRFELYSVADPDQVNVTDLRFNQNYLVGMGVLNYRDGYSNLAHGSTVPLWALVPRVVWPDKPEIGGGRDVVSEFTGINFAEGTSIGVGQPLEFFMNFGWTGLIGGFLVLGFLFARLDRLLIRGLRQRKVLSILVGGLIGMALMQPGGNLMEATVSSVAALICALGTAFVLERFAAARLARQRLGRSAGPADRASIGR